MIEFKKIKKNSLDLKPLEIDVYLKIIQIYSFAIENKTKLKSIQLLFKINGSYMGRKNLYLIRNNKPAFN